MEGRPSAALQDVLERLFVVVVDDQLVHRQSDLPRDVERAQDAPLLVAMRAVDHHDHVVLDGELQLPLVGALFGFGDLVVADLTDRDNALLEGEAR